MHCPFCKHIDTRVIDSRLVKDKNATRRRRECEACRRRFTTYEHIEEPLPMVVKRDTSREAFDTRKIVAGVQRACEKRPVAADAIERLVAGIERMIVDGGEREVSSKLIGEAVMASLRDVDEVAYVRFASVYRDFRDVNEFMAELSSLLSERQQSKA